jgi:hypothetical protein
MHKVVVLDYIKQWQVFKDDEKIKSFLTLMDEYSNMNKNSNEKEDET